MFSHIFQIFSNWHKKESRHPGGRCRLFGVWATFCRGKLTPIPINLESKPY